MSSKSERLLKLSESIADCQKCNLCSTRNRMVFGEGDPESPIVLIGEAPGREEDLQGRPFIGKSGRLLEELIHEVFEKSRQELYITNIVKCRPTLDFKMEKDRPPTPDELTTCLPHLIEQLKILSPKAVITLGQSATRGLLHNKEGITKIRGHWREFASIALMPTFHPSYVLRNGGKKSKTCEMMCADFQLVKEFVKMNSLHDH